MKSPLCSQTDVNFHGLYLFETIANQQQSAGIKSSSAAGTVCSAYHGWKTEFSGHTTQWPVAAPQWRLNPILTHEAVT